MSKRQKKKGLSTAKIFWMHRLELKNTPTNEVMLSLLVEHNFIPKMEIPVSNKTKGELIFQAYLQAKTAYRHPSNIIRKIENKLQDYTEYRALSEKFLSSPEWRRLRYDVLKERGARCECCGATPSTGAVMNVDHIKPRKTHPHLSLQKFNLQVLCGDCNAGKGNRDSTDWRKNVSDDVSLSDLSDDQQNHLKSMMH